MAFKATDGAAQLSNALAVVMSLARQVRTMTSRLRDQSAAGSVIVVDIAEYMDELMRMTGELSALKTTPGLAQYAKDQFSDQTYDIAAEFLAMQNAMVATVDWIAANLPSDGRWLLMHEIMGKRLVQRTLSSAETAGLRTKLDVLIAAIE